MEAYEPIFINFNLDDEMLKYAARTGSSVLTIEAWHIFKFYFECDEDADTLHEKFWNDLFPNREVNPMLATDPTMRLLLDCIPPITCLQEKDNYDNVQTKSITQACREEAERNDDMNFNRQDVCRLSRHCSEAINRFRRSYRHYRPGPRAQSE